MTAVFSEAHNNNVWNPSASASGRSGGILMNAARTASPSPLIKKAVSPRSTSSASEDSDSNDKDGYLTTTTTISADSPEDKKLNLMPNTNGSNQGITGPVPSNTAAAGGQTSTLPKPKIRFAPLPDPRRQRSLSTGRNIQFDVSVDEGGVRRVQITSVVNGGEDESALDMDDSDNDIRNEIRSGRSSSREDDKDDERDNSASRLSSKKSKRSSWGSSSSKPLTGSYTKRFFAPLLSTSASSSSVTSSGVPLTKSTSLESNVSNSKNNKIVNSGSKDLFATWGLTPNSKPHKNQIKVVNATPMDPTYSTLTPSTPASRTNSETSPSRPAFSSSNSYSDIPKTLLASGAAAVDRVPSPSPYITAAPLSASRSLDPNETSQAARRRNNRTEEQQLPRSPVGVKMLNGRRYGAKRQEREREVMAKAQAPEREFVEWGTAHGSNSVSVGGRGEDDDDGSGMGWVRRRREAREKKEREEAEAAAAAALAATTYISSPTPTASGAATPTPATTFAVSTPDDEMDLEDVLAVSTDSAPTTPADEAATTTMLAPTSMMDERNRRMSHQLESFVIPGKKHSQEGAGGHATVGAVSIASPTKSKGEEDEDDEEEEEEEEEDDDDDEDEEEEDAENDDDEEDENEEEEEMANEEARKTAECAGVEVVSRHKN